MKLVYVVLFALLLWSPAFPVLAAITYVGGQTGSFPGTTGSTDITFALTGGTDATPLNGDFVVVTYCTATVGDATLEIKKADDTFYTLFGTEGWSNDTFDTNRRTAYLAVSGTPDTVVRLGNTGGIANAGGYDIHVFRGVNATPLEQAVQEGNNLNTSIVNPGGITPTTSGTFIYVAGCGALAVKSLEV